MNAVTRLKAAGFTVRFIPPDSIGITPVERLTHLQRQWVTAHRGTILSELKKHSSNGRCRLDRWHRFIKFSVSHGAEPAEVRAMFNQQDIEDLLGEPDHKLPLHARTIADAVKRTHLIIRP